ncbi:MAG: sterol desaturase family protein [Pseudomonadota bacterium]
MDDSIIRFGVFLLVFSLMALWEMVAPKRAGSGPRQSRWTTNLSLVVVDGIAVRIFLPITAIGAAELAAANGIGLFNMLSWHGIVIAIVAFLVLDFAIWFQHLVFHKVPWLWRLHSVHHADLDVDVTTGIRFHPIEIILSMVWKVLVVLAIGAPAVVVFAFEVVLNGAAMFNHANVRLPRTVDRILRLLVVTPDMHRVHHSVEIEETDSNYGFNLSIWDRLFGTYRAAPKAGHGQMVIGLAEYQTDDTARLGWSLLFPFRGHFKRKRTSL